MNEVTILVKAKSEVAPVFAKVRGEVKNLASETEKLTTQTDKLETATGNTTRRTIEYGVAVREVSRKVDDQGDKVDRLQRRLRILSLGKYDVEVEVDRDGRLSRGLSKVDSKITNLLDSAGGALEDLSAKIAGVLPGAIGGALTAAGPVVQTAVVALGAVIVTALSSFIAAGLSAGILAALGGGVLVAGIASAIQSDKIDEILNGKKVITRSALNKKGDKTPNFGADVESREGGLLPKIKDMFTAFGTPFVDPLARALDKVNDALDKAGPKLDELGRKFAPLIDTLAPALMTMADRAWPGLNAAIDASLPLFDTLAQYLPVIGSSIGQFFQVIADHGPEANRAFGQLLTLIAAVIVALSSLVGWLLTSYGAFMRLKDAFSNSSFGGFLLGPINTILRLIALLDNAIDKKSELEGGISGSGRTLPSGETGNAGLSAADSSAGLRHRASGGISGGLTRVAERGGEMLRLPQGSMVWANGQSTQMVSQESGRGNGGAQVVELRVTGSGALYEVLMTAMRGGELQVPRAALT